MNVKGILAKFLYIIAVFLFVIGFDFVQTYAYLDDIDEFWSLKVHYIDVWQGDATFIELPNGETILIDGGEKEYGSVVKNYIKKLNYSRIDYLFATHPHSDHIGGLTEIVNSFDIGNIYMPDVSIDTSSYYDLLKAIKSKNEKVKVAKPEELVINDGDLSLQILAPISSNYEDLNNYSIVLKLIYKEKSFLFMADAEYDSEMELLKNSNIKADVLKVGHHGSNSSTNYNFLKKVDPSIAIISVGTNNDYGHPQEKILSKLKQRDIEIYRTDLNGDIVVITDGINLKVRTARGSSS